jgi:hypothetical protein
MPELFETAIAMSAIVMVAATRELKFEDTCCTIMQSPILVKFKKNLL